jgi:hypothetical protein
MGGGLVDISSWSIAHNRRNGRRVRESGMCEVNALARLCVCATTTYAGAATERAINKNALLGAETK